MNLPPPIRQFIENKTTTSIALLPLHYPGPETFEGYQSAFRYHGLTGEDLTSTEKGKWQPGWHIIALNVYDDPFFVDFLEAHKNFPVYYSAHDAGNWEAIKVADNIAAFSLSLLNLQDIGDHKATTLHYLKLNTDLNNSFWSEVYAQVQGWNEEAPEGPYTDPGQLIPGILTITDMGNSKLKMVHFLKEYLGLSPAEALALSKQLPIELARGYLLQLQRTIDRLNSLGATVQFIPDKT